MRYVYCMDALGAVSNKTSDATNDATAWCPAPQAFTYNVGQAIYDGRNTDGAERHAL